MTPQTGGDGGSVHANDPRTSTERRKYRASASRSRGPCVICGERIDYSLRFPHPRSFSGHHLHSIGQGGKVDGPTGPSHLRCNQQLGDRTQTIPHSQEW